MCILQRESGLKPHARVPLPAKELASAGTGENNSDQQGLIMEPFLFQSLWRCLLATCHRVAVWRCVEHLATYHAAERQEIAYEAPEYTLRGDSRAPGIHVPLVLLDAGTKPDKKIGT